MVALLDCGVTSSYRMVWMTWYVIGWIALGAPLIYISAGHWITDAGLTGCYN